MSACDGGGMGCSVKDPLGTYTLPGCMHGCSNSRHTSCQVRSCPVMSCHVMSHTTLLKYLPQSVYVAADPLFKKKKKKKKNRNTDGYMYMNWRRRV